MMIRTTPVEYGTKPYAWNIPSVFQCTWYSYFRAIERNLSAPCYFDRETKSGSYTNAKDWLKNYREPWEVKGLDYTPKANDIVVYDGEYGHVQFMETDTMYSQYSSGREDSFRNGLLSEYKGIILGYLHYPYESLDPVERNINVTQIQTTDTSLRIRIKPSLKGEIVGYVQLGYYDVLEEKEADGYTWYRIGKDRWCANISTIYLPSENTDIIRELEKYINGFKTQYQVLFNENENLKKRLKEIHSLSEVD